MTIQEIASKLWKLCNILRDDGNTNHQYVTELTYILLLKMAKEMGVEDQIPEAYRWDKLTDKVYRSYSLSKRRNPLIEIISLPLYKSPLVPSRDKIQRKVG